MNGGEGGPGSISWASHSSSQAFSFCQVAAGCAGSPKSVLPGDRVQLMAGGYAVCSLPLWLCCVIATPSVDPGVQQLCMEGKEGSPPHVLLDTGNPDM